MKITEGNFVGELKKGNDRALEYVIKNHIDNHNYLMDFYEECMNACLQFWENIQYYKKIHL